MTKWEYCQVTHIVSQGASEHIQTLTFFGLSEVQEEDIEDAPKAIARLGLDGWEMVSQSFAVTSGDEGLSLYFFKRPLSE